MTSDDLLLALPNRDVTEALLEYSEAACDGFTYAHAMTSAVGGARLEAVLRSVEQVLGAGLGRPLALMVLHGGLVRLERDGHSSYSDTVVRENICAALEPACDSAGAEPFTDDEVGEVALLLSLRAVAGAEYGLRLR